MEEKTENNNVVNNKEVTNYNVIETILDDDRLIKIYGFLPDKESKKDFLKTLLETYEDRLSEKFSQRLEDEFEPSDFETKQSQLKENIRNKRSIEDILRSRRRTPLTKGVTERINYLISELQKGNYISKEDRELLAKHLAERSDVVGTSPSSRREEIRSTIDEYIRAKNKENKNSAEAYNYKQDLQRNILILKEKLREKILHQNDPITHIDANVTHYGEDINENPYDRVTKRRKREIEGLKNQIAELEELLNVDETTNPLNSMLNDPDSKFDLEKNNMELEDLMDILDKESKELLKKGVRLADTGIRKDDEVIIKEDEIVDERENEKDEQQKITPAEIENVVNENSKNLQIISETSATKQLIKADEQKQIINVEDQQK